MRRLRPLRGLHRSACPCRTARSFRRRSSAWRHYSLPSGGLHAFFCACSITCRHRGRRAIPGVERGKWRRVSESTRSSRFCNPVPSTGFSEPSPRRRIRAERARSGNLIRSFEAVAWPVVLRFDPKSGRRFRTQYRIAFEEGFAPGPEEAAPSDDKQSHLPHATDQNPEIGVGGNKEDTASPAPTSTASQLGLAGVVMESETVSETSSCVPDDSAVELDLTFAEFWRV